MTKRSEAKYKIDRRMGQNIWGRPKSPVNRREYGPGQHGQRRKGKLSDFGTQLKAKQKLKGYYGNISEKQFRKYYAEAIRMKGDSGDNMIGLLERRLDAVVYRAKFVPTVFAARQFVNHGHVKVNGRRVNIASYLVKPGDVVEVKEASRQLVIVLEAVGLAERDVPDYYEVDHSKMTAKLTRVPLPVRRALSGADGAEPGHRILFALISSASLFHRPAGAGQERTRRRADARDSTRTHCVRVAHKRPPSGGLFSLRGQTPQTAARLIHVNDRKRVERDARGLQRKAGRRRRLHCASEKSRESLRRIDRSAVFRRR